MVTENEGVQCFSAPASGKTTRVGRTLTCWRRLLLIQRNMEPSFQVRNTCDQLLESVRAEGPVPFAVARSSCRKLQMRSIHGLGVQERAAEESVCARPAKTNENIEILGFIYLSRRLHCLRIFSCLVIHG